MEMMYHYIWKHRMLGTQFKGIEGEKVSVLNPGIHNTDSGPDFSEARIEIDGQMWAGNVEIHEKASDWFRHGHHTDPAYDSVILHAVGTDDCTVSTNSGIVPPQVELSFPDSFRSLYTYLTQKLPDVKCKSQLPRFPAIAVRDWMESLAVERMQRKAGDALRLAETLGNDWNQACFVLLARYLGMGLNNDPFEMLARSLPLRILHSHSDNSFQTEALLFGQAGMLDTSIHIFDEYYQALAREYFFLARKYGLRPMRGSLWKYCRTRPNNFPTRRIAILAKAVANGFPLLSDLSATIPDIEKTDRLFRWTLDGYWNTHSDFDVAAHGLPPMLGKGARLSLLVNFAAPLAYAHAVSTGDCETAEQACSLWHALPPESNKYIRQWEVSGIKADTASDSQALIQLRREYCDRSRCLECRFGHRLLREHAAPQSVQLL